MLDIVASYHCMHFQGKLMMQTLENSEKPHFWPDLGPLGPIFFFSKIWLRESLDIIVSYSHVGYQKILMIQSRENL